MIRTVFAALLVVGMALTGCSGSTTSQPTMDNNSPTVTTTPPAETTVTIAGKEWTCTQFAQSAGSEHCNELMQQTFDTTKENINAYVTSGKLGALNERTGFAYEEIAFAGLMACAYTLDGRDRNEYYRDLTENPRFNSRITMGAMYVHAWNEATNSLCPGLKPVS